MEVHFTPDREAGLAEIANNAGTDAEKLLKEAALRLLQEDARFRAAVREGIAQADRGEFIEEEEMNARLEQMLRPQVRIRWTPAAAADLEHISEYLKGRHPQYREATIISRGHDARALRRYSHPEEIARAWPPRPRGWHARAIVSAATLRRGVIVTPFWTSFSTGRRPVCSRVQGSCGLTPVIQIAADFWVEIIRDHEPGGAQPSRGSARSSPVGKWVYPFRSSNHRTGC